MTAELRRALLRGRRRPRMVGAGSPTAFRGDGYEFVELREYVAGDDPRRIDWAATARAGALQTRVVLEDVALTLAAIVDDSDSMRLGRERPLLRAASEALQAWYGAAETDDRCVRITSAGVYAPASLRGRRSALVCANVQSSALFGLRTTLEVARVALPIGTALLVISDFLDMESALDELLLRLASRLDCTALIAQDPWCDGLPLRGFVTLRDAETGAQRRTFVGVSERERYLRAVMDRDADLRARLARAGWRTGSLREENGEHSLMRAFGL
jgi:uncharacterized protein (DUF58 family)